METNSFIENKIQKLEQKIINNEEIDAEYILKNHSFLQFFVEFLNSHPEYNSLSVQAIKVFEKIYFSYNHIPDADTYTEEEYKKASIEYIEPFLDQMHDILDQGYKDVILLILYYFVENEYEIQELLDDYLKEDLEYIVEKYENIRSIELIAMSTVISNIKTHLHNLNYSSLTERKLRNIIQKQGKMLQNTLKQKL